MKKILKIRIYPFAIMAVILILSNSCTKDESSSSSKTDPVITWANPADISVGTSLSATQLNATADVPGSFVYTPGIGTKLNEGANQNLKADFTPTDAATYNTVGKTVKLNVTGSSNSGIIFNPNLTYGTMTDQEGNVYKTITIGTQTWMAENLRTTKYRNGDNITNMTLEWGGPDGAYCWYANDGIANKFTYGALYNWTSATDSRRLAPTGWHVPTDAEWSVLLAFLGDGAINGGKLKETGTTHWHGSNGGSTNETGFTGLPGGYRSGQFGSLGDAGEWWSSSEKSMFLAWHWYLSILTGKFSRGSADMSNGKSVRCILGDKIDPIITWPNPADIVFGTLLGNEQLNASANAPGSFVYTPVAGTMLNEGANQDLKVDFTPADGIAYHSASKTVKINVIAAPGNGIVFNPNLTYGTMTDQDGNEYKTITIGTQTWMAENLRTTKYRNGDPIPTGVYGTTWGNLTIGAYCNYNNYAAGVITYGRLYNWRAVVDSRNIAPAGWHVSSDDEWWTLVVYLGGGTIAGDKLRETGTTHWSMQITAVTNESGFTALPGGGRHASGEFEYIYGSGYWWTTTQSSSSLAVEWNIQTAWSNLYMGSNNKSDGFSVRCVKD